MHKEENRREFFRHQFHIPLCAEMRIAEISGKAIETKHSPVCIRDIGAGGLRFQTNLKLPIRDDVVMSFHITMMNQTVELRGVLMRCEQLENKDFEYGLKFCFLSEDRQHHLLALINKVSITLRKGINGSGCSMCSLKTECFKSALLKQKEYHLSE